MTTFGPIAIICGTIIHGPQRVNPNFFNNPLTFYPVQLAGPDFDVSSEIDGLSTFCMHIHGSQMMYPKD